MGHTVALARWLLATVVFIATGDAAATNRPAPLADVGELIFRSGLLAHGKPVTGERAANIDVFGADAACAKCHRRSGLGAAEGQFVIPPVTGRFLFNARGRHSSQPDLRLASGFIPNRKPYDEASLARAIRAGVDSSGRQLNALMPRYKLSSADMASLIAYLRDFASAPVPGVTDDTLHFATVITPDADPRKRQGMLDVLNQFFLDKNEFIRGGIKPMQTAGGVQFRVSRRWQLHVWQLAGTPETWQSQLDRKLAAEPVFAVISGLGGTTWAPIHDFCERKAVPCLFPNTDIPVVDEDNYYSLYFSKGVQLEAELLASVLNRRNGTDHGPPRVVQILRADDIGSHSASVLDAAMKRIAVSSVDVVVARGDAKAALAEAVSQIRAGDVAVFWLRPDDIRALPATPPDAAALYFSGVMAELENSTLAPAWRQVAQLTYPFDLPAQRKFRMDYPLGWFKVRHINLVDERVQSSTYLACGILAEQLTAMQDSFVREFLVERIEDMLSHRIMSGYYPRLGLAPDQRFASKGGYLVHFVSESGPSIEAATDWTVP